MQSPPDVRRSHAQRSRLPFPMFFVLTKTIQAEGRHYGDTAYIVTQHPDKLIADGWSLHRGALPSPRACDALFNAAMVDKIGHAVSLALDESRGNY